MILAFDFLLQVHALLLELIKVSLESQKTFFEVTREHCLNRPLLGLRMVHLSALDQFFEESLFFCLPLFNDVLKHGAEIVVFENVFNV